VVLEITKSHNGVHVGRTFGNQWRKSRFKTPYLRNSLWEEGYGIDTLETAVTWRNVNNTLSEIEGAIIKTSEGVGENVHVFSHLSHIYPTGSSIYTTYVFRLGKNLEKTKNRWRMMKQPPTKVILKYNGTISHQHGVGTDHIKHLLPEKGRIGIDAIKSICSQFDPNGLLNPGKLVM
jgi:alkyldihydroxyacetonephosphate synthase